MLPAILVRYLADLESSSLAPATRKAIRTDLYQFVQWWERTMKQPFDITLLSNRDLRAWQRSRQIDDGAKPSTINRALVSLRRFCAWAQEQNVLGVDPTVTLVDLSMPQPPPRSLSKIALDALLRAAHAETDTRVRARDEALLALLIYAGLRTQEVCSVQLRDLDMETATLTVRSGRDHDMRRVPLESDALDLLQRYLTDVRCPTGLPMTDSSAACEPLLIGIDVTASGRPNRLGISTRMIRHIVHTHGQQAAQTLHAASIQEPDSQRRDQLVDAAQSLLTVAPHMLRHSFACRMLKCGARLPEVQRILGHRHLSTTGMYRSPDL